MTRALEINLASLSLALLETVKLTDCNLGYNGKNNEQCNKSVIPERDEGKKEYIFIFEISSG